MNDQHTIEAVFDPVREEPRLTTGATTNGVRSDLLDSQEPTPIALSLPSFPREHSSEGEENQRVALENESKTSMDIEQILATLRLEQISTQDYENALIDHDSESFPPYIFESLENLPAIPNSRTPSPSSHGELHEQDPPTSLRDTSRTVGEESLNTNVLNTNALDANVLDTNSLGTNALDSDSLDINDRNANVLDTDVFSTNGFDTDVLNEAAQLKQDHEPSKIITESGKDHETEHIVQDVTSSPTQVSIPEVHTSSRNIDIFDVSDVDESKENNGEPASVVSTAPPVDAPVEAPSVDAHVEAPVYAPVEAPPVDAPVEAPSVDAPVDAPPVEAPMDVPVDVHVDEDLGFKPKKGKKNKKSKRDKNTNLDGLLSIGRLNEEQQNQKMNMIDIKSEQSALNEEHIDKYVNEPVYEPINETVYEPVHDFIDELVVEPVESVHESVHQSVQEAFQEPVREPVHELIQKSIQEPIQEPIQKPIQELIHEPVDKPVQEFAHESVQEPIQDFAHEPADEPVDGFVQESIQKPIQ